MPISLDIATLTDIAPVLGCLCMLPLFDLVKITSNIYDVT